MSSRNRSQRAREQVGLTLAQASRLLGIPAMDLICVEESDSSYFDTDRGKMAEVYGVGIAWMDGEGDDKDYATIDAMRGADKLSSHDRDTLASFAASIPRRPLIDPLIASSSIGAGLQRIRDRGIEVELAHLDEELSLLDTRPELLVEYDPDIETVALICTIGDCGHGVAYLLHGPPTWATSDGVTESRLVSGQEVPCPFCDTIYTIPSMDEVFKSRESSDDRRR